MSELKVLVVDDSETMRKVIEMTCRGQGVQLSVFASPYEALERAAEIDPDVVLADASMEGLDGYAFVQAMRERPRVAGKPALLLTSRFNPIDDARAERAQVDGHIVKPFDTQKFLDTVRAIAAEPPDRPTPPPRAASAGLRNGNGHALPSMKPQPSTPPTLSGGATNPSFGSSIGVGSASMRGGEVARARRSSAPAAPSFNGSQGSPGISSLPPSRNAPSSSPPPVPVSTSIEPGPATAGGDAVALLKSRLAALGVSGSVQGEVVQLFQDAVEQITWEVVPDMAETVIKEELRRLLAAR